MPKCAKENLKQNVESRYRARRISYICFVTSYLPISIKRFYIYQMPKIKSNLVPIVVYQKNKCPFQKLSKNDVSIKYENFQVKPDFSPGNMTSFSYHTTPFVWACLRSRLHIATCIVNHDTFYLLDVFRFLRKAPSVKYGCHLTSTSEQSSKCHTQHLFRWYMRTIVWSNFHHLKTKLDLELQRPRKGCHPQRL